MFNLEVYRFHWIWFALSLGAILVLWTVLTYVAIWRVRGAEREAQLEITGLRSFSIWLLKTFTMVLLLTMLGTALLALIYPVLKSFNPPNW
jgi:hypothetical protein